MRNSRKVTIVLLGLAMAAPVYAQQPGSGPDVVVVGEQVNPEQRVVCKSQRATGTRFEKKTCMTVRQWDAVREQHRRDAKEMFDGPQIETRRGN